MCLLIWQKGQHLFLRVLAFIRTTDIEFDYVACKYVKVLAKADNVLECRPLLPQSLLVQSSSTFVSLYTNSVILARL